MNEIWSVEVCECVRLIDRKSSGWSSGLSSGLSSGSSGIGWMH